jgi:hypothetical protein
VTGDQPMSDYLTRHGRPISYGYLHGRWPLADYQTVFARHPGSAEMPSAGRPFTAELVTDLISRGIAFAPITLHTGVSSQEAGEPPQAERFEVPASTARLVNATRLDGGRVIAVGTTVTRALESAAGAAMREANEAFRAAVREAAAVAADALDDTRTLVAEHHRRRSAPLPADDVQVAAADAHRSHPNEHLAGVWLLEVDRDGLEWLVRRAEDRRERLHRSASITSSTLARVATVVSA